MIPDKQSKRSIYFLSVLVYSLQLLSTTRFLFLVLGFDPDLGPRGRMFESCCPDSPESLVLKQIWLSLKHSPGALTRLEPLYELSRIFWDDRQLSV